VDAGLSTNIYIFTSSTTVNTKEQEVDSESMAESEIRSERAAFPSGTLANTCSRAYHPLLLAFCLTISNSQEYTQRKRKDTPS
jgi:hypothetical protein